MTTEASKSIAARPQISAPATPRAPAGATPKPAVQPRSRSSRAYRQMLLIRRFEEKAGQLYGMG